MKLAQSWLKKLEDQLFPKEEKKYFQIHQARYLFILQQLINYFPSQKLKILDVGCFPYHIAKILEDLGHEVWGICSPHEPLEKKNVKILNIEKEKFPFRKNFFDLVLFNEIIEHLSCSPIPALKESLRVTKKGGLFFLTTPNVADLFNRLALLSGKNIMYSLDYFRENNGEGSNIYHRHNREYTPGEITKLLAETNWRIIKKKFFISYHPFRKGKKEQSVILKGAKIANYLISLTFPHLRDSFFICARK
ncbi:MAG: methyltransferase domain-containing protein [Candidatus Shapirobacteria bacterium]